MIIARFWDRSLIYNSQLLSFGSVHFSCSVVSDFATLWTAARQASLSITNSRSLLTLMCIQLVMPSNHLILCCPFLLPPSIFPSNRVFSTESVLCIRWPKYWSFSFSISPSNECSGQSLIRKLKARNVILCDQCGLKRGLPGGPAVRTLSFHYRRP